MLKRFYADNYQAFSDFELADPGQLVLIVGHNGAGKSTLVDVVRKLTTFVWGGPGADVGTLFPPKLRTRWDERPDQAFEVSLISQDGRQFDYRLLVQHSADGGGTRVGEESLTVNGQVLMHARGRTAILGSESSTQIEIQLDPRRSVVPVLNLVEVLEEIQDQAGVADTDRHPDLPGPEARISATAAQDFQYLTRSIHAVRINPFSQKAISDQRGAERLSLLTHNFPTWYPAKEIAQPEKAELLREQLGEAIPGFQKFVVASDERGRRSLFADGASGLMGWDELSDGQRCLCILYALLAFSAPNSVLFIDDPAAFLSPQEVQPWLNTLHEWCDGGGQVFMTTHSPQVLDLVGHAGLLFRRDSGGKRVLPPISVEDVQARHPELRLSEILSLDWA